MMRLTVLLLAAFLLTACGGQSQPALPPELQGTSPLNNLPPVLADPLAEFPLETESLETPPEETAETTPETTTPDATTPVVAGNCEAITLDLETSFADMNFCETNDDCSVAIGSCPFGCYLFHNSKIDFADYQPTLAAYQESCNPCEYKCAAAPRVTDRRCIEGRCVDTRYQE